MSRKAPQRRIRVEPVGFLIVLYSVMIAYALVFIAQSIFPEKYFRDSLTIQMFMDGLMPASVSEAPANKTGELFTALHLTGGEIQVGLVGVTLYVLLVVAVMRRIHTTVIDTILLAAGLVLAGVYLGVYSKEFFVVPLVILMVVIGKKWWWEALWFAVVLLYSLQLRASWILTACVYVAFRVILTLSRRRTTFVWLTVALIVFLAVAFYFILGEALHFHRTDVVEKLSEDINTSIQNPLPGADIVSSTLNGIYSLTMFVFPVALAAMLSPIYVAAALLIGLLAVLLARSMKFALNEKRGEVPVEYWRALSLLLAYVFVQSLYAPDWGAYVRHITPLLPLAVWLVGMTRQFAPSDDWTTRFMSAGSRFPARYDRAMPRSARALGQ